jgi:hypothetical protein
LGQKVKNQEESDWGQARYSPDRNLLDSGAIRIALLFGSAALAFTLILAPIVDRGAGNYLSKRGNLSGLDNTATGSVLKAHGYTLRRSVLHSGPASVCIIDEDGRQSGNC